MSKSAAVVLDNGAYTAKVGLSTQEKPSVIPNCIMKAKAERRRAFIGNQIDDCRDASGLFYILGFQKGYLLNWDVQKSVWDHIFSAEGSGISLDDRPVLITEPQLNFQSIQEVMMEILFEEYHCSGVHKTTAADCAAYKHGLGRKEVPLEKRHCLVIDVGYSFTHVVPFVGGKRQELGIRRLEIGGKLLTNHLKELISYRHLNVMDESYVVNQIKEDVCYVSQNFNEDMRKQATPKQRNEIVVEYVLPDFTTHRRGFIRGGKAKAAKEGRGQKENSAPVEHMDVDDDSAADMQSVRLCNERFTVPELLFHPDDVGIRQIGLPETVLHCLSDCPEDVHNELLRNIVVIGGSSLFPGFPERLKAEIRAQTPDDYQVEVFFPEDPITYGWQGGKALASSSAFKNLLFTREEYEESGYTLGSGR